jgi:uncharacterized iron-regulated membrane protein
MKEEHFRQNMAWLHTWAGLLCGWVMFFVVVTGTAAFFSNEITRWMQPEWPLRVEQPQFPPAAEMAEKAVDFLVQQREPTNYWVISFPSDGRRIGNLGNKGGENARGYQSVLSVYWGQSQRLDPFTGAAIMPIATRDTHGGEIFKDLHYKLHYMDSTVALYIVGILTLMMFVALITGLIVHKRIFKDFFTFRPGKGARSWLDGHHVAGLMALPFVLMIVYSGVALNLSGYMPASDVVLPDVEKPLEFPPPLTRPALPMAHFIGEAEKVLGKGEVGEMLIERSGEKMQIQVYRHWGTQYPFANSTNKLYFDGETGERLPPKTYTTGGIGMN